MGLAVLIPLRVRPSGGALKHLEEVIPRFAANAAIESVSIIAPKGILNGMSFPGGAVRLVSERDYKTGFREMRQIVNAGKYDVALCMTARPIRRLTCPNVLMVQNIEPIQNLAYRMSLLWRLRLWAYR